VVKVIGLVCSPRRKKHTYDFVDSTLKKLEEKGVETTLLYLRDYELSLVSSVMLKKSIHA